MQLAPVEIGRGGFGQVIRLVVGVESDRFQVQRRVVGALFRDEALAVVKTEDLADGLAVAFFALRGGGVVDQDRAEVFFAVLAAEVVQGRTPLHAESAGEFLL